MPLACLRVLSDPPPYIEADTVKGALFHNYDLRTHPFVAHICRVHPLNKDIEVEQKVKIVVKAAKLCANPLAAQGEPLDYTHSKTKMCYNFFFMTWDNIMAPTIAIMCPWFTIGSKKALDRLFQLEFKK